jgi:putative oxidoreductase
MPPTGPAPRIDAGLLLLRFGVGTILAFHGYHKIMNGVAWIAGPLGRVGLPAWVAYGTYVAEVLGPILLILGLFVRPAALVIAFNMFMAIFLARRGDVAKISPMGGGWAIEVEVLLLIAALALALAGGGRYGLGGGGTTGRR